uniref:Uncharacterized protein n=1 Tax=Aegilops tauschii subsp. strangulata TaxID=200361 RepID=A0A453C9U2_AEGTS
MMPAYSAPSSSLLRADEAHPPVVHVQTPPRFSKLEFVTYDGTVDPLNWLNQCDQFFRGQRSLASDRTWIASYHLRGAVVLRPRTGRRRHATMGALPRFVPLALR